MTCASMIDRMLEADLSELAGRGSSPLAMHLRECGRCRAMARQIVRHTGDLASLPARDVISVADARTPRARLIGRVSRYATIGIAAAALIVVGRGIGRVDPTSRASRVERTRATGTVSVARTEAGTPVPDGTRRAAPARPPSAGALGRRTTARALGGETVVPSAASSPARPVTTEPVVVAAIPRAVATTPVRLDPPQRSPLGTRVAVEPPVGTRVDIIRTANPGVTVVWLY